jgi:hypothetical protein
MRIGFDASAECCECGRFVGPIQLPDSILALLNRNPKGPIVGFGPLFVACPECGRVSGYSFPQIHLQIVGMPDHRQIPPNRRSIRAQRECGEENCKIRITIHTAVASDISKRQQRDALEKASGEWHFDWTVRCRNGHYLIQAPRMTYFFEGFDLDAIQ